MVYGGSVFVQLLLHGIFQFIQAAVAHLLGKTDDAGVGGSDLPGQFLGAQLDEAGGILLDILDNLPVRLGKLIGHSVDAGHQSKEFIIFCHGYVCHPFITFVVTL